MLQAKNCLLLHALTRTEKRLFSVKSTPDFYASLCSSKFNSTVVGLGTFLGIVCYRPPFLPSPLLNESHVLEVVGELRVPADVPHEADVVPVGVAKSLLSKTIRLLERDKVS